MMKSKLEEYDNFGIGYNDNEAVLTWAIERPTDNGFSERYGLDRTSMFLSENNVIPMDGYFVAPYGKQHNNLPLEVRELIRENPYLPELLEKQIRFLFGAGPMLYREVIKNGVTTREQVAEPRIQAWLDSWTANGLQNYAFYLLEQIREFYYAEGIFNKFQLRKSRRTGGSLPVVGIEAVGTRYARFASKDPKYLKGASLDKKDFTWVLEGDWLRMHDNSFDAFPKFDEAAPLKHAVAVNYTANSSFGEEIYALLPWFYGLKEWIKASNLNPKYLNSFLKNSLAARLHVVIPHSYTLAKEKVLKRLCERNKELRAEDKPIQEKYMGVPIGTEFRQEMVDKLTQNKLRQITELMSGEGKNQGKLFSSQSFMTDNGIEQWEFKEIPMKSKEYVDTIISLDKRAVDVILAGKGLDASLSNVSKDGVISKSGADAYYNYMIYISLLGIPETVVTYDINLAIKLNFPGTDIKLGFNRPVVQRQEDVAPDNRMNKNVE